MQSEVQQGRTDWVESVKEVHFSFNNLIIPARTPEQLQVLQACRDGLDPHFVLRPSDQQVLINPGVWSVNCPTVFPNDYSTEDLKSMVEVDGATNYTIEYAFSDFDPVNLFQPTVTVRIFFNDGETENKVKLTLLEDGMESIEGGEPLPLSQTIRVRRFTRRSIRRVQRLAESMGLMAAVGVGVALTTSVGTAVASSATSTGMLKIILPSSYSNISPILYLKSCFISLHFAAVYGLLERAAQFTFMVS